MRISTPLPRTKDRPGVRLPSLLKQRWLLIPLILVIIAAVVILFNVQKYVIIFATAILGAGVIVGAFLFLFGANDFGGLAKALIADITGAKQAAFTGHAAGLGRSWQDHFRRRGGCLGIRGKRQ